MTEIAIKGASGLGDSIYLVPIAKHYSTDYDQINIMTNYPMLFEHLPKVKCYKHEKLNYIRIPGGQIPINQRFTYGARKYTPGTSQYTDYLMFGNVDTNIPLEMDWAVRSTELIGNIKKNAMGDKICILSAPYVPFGRVDEWGAILRIKPDIMQAIVDKYKNDIYFVQVGNEFALHRIKGVQLDLISKTSVADLLDLVSICDIGLSQIGNLLPLCECLNKKNFLIFSQDAMQSENRFCAAITPDKTVHYKDLNLSVIDNIKNTSEHIDKCVGMFGELIK